MRSSPKLTFDFKNRLVYVTVADSCIGHIIGRGRDRLEAFDADDRSLGLFKTDRDAVAAILGAQRSGGCAP
jgi:hypothetical protein